MQEIVISNASFSSVGEIKLILSDDTFFGTVEVSAGNEYGKPYYFRLGHDLVTFDIEIERFLQKNPQYINEIRDYFGNKIILGEDEVYYF